MARSIGCLDYNGKEYLATQIPRGNGLPSDEDVRKMLGDRVTHAEFESRARKDLIPGVSIIDSEKGGKK